MIVLPALCRLPRQVFLAFILLCLALAANAEDKPRITVSIHPLGLLVAEVAGTEVELHTLVESGQSPHNFQLRPSDRRRLEQADLVFWIGPSLELFLQDLLNQEGLRQKSVALAPEILPEQFGASSSPAPDEAAHDEHKDDHAAGEHHAGETAEAHHHAHAEGELNPHIWLEPGLARELAGAIAQALKQTGLFDQAQIDANVAEFEARLTATDQRIQAQLDQSEDATLFTYHEAFELFASHYGLEIAGSLTFSPEVQPGARHLSLVRDRLRAAQNPCVLTEPQYSRQWWRSITQGVDLAISQWDPLASDIEAKPGGYTEFLEELAQAVLDCQKET